MGCTPVKIKSRRVCVGDLKHRITIQIRALTPNNTGSIEAIETFTDVIDVWAAIETTRGSQMWDGVEISNPFTHKIYIRFRDDMDFNKWIEFEGEKYDIVDVQDLDQRNEWLLLLCTLKGETSKEANFA
ncbi:phage head closure protein [Candidatus Pacearchaeota archaeon]|nr:phage head closure protein [Candidatus Pacearchaeota archaeon]